MKRLLKDFNESFDKPIRIYCDNQGSIQLGRNLIFYARTKHIELHYHYVREHIIAEDIDLQHISTDRQTTDIFTKKLGVDKLQQFSMALGLRSLDISNLRRREAGLILDNTENRKPNQKSNTTNLKLKERVERHQARLGLVILSIISLSSYINRI